MQGIFSELHSQEIHDILRLIKKILLFSTPLIFVFLLNFIVDPFNLNRLISLPLPKEEVAPYFNERLWKLNSIHNSQSSSIILGDSRAARLSEKTLHDITGKKFVNLAFSGATLIEIIDTFWFVVSKYTPQDITLCINFDRFNDWQKANGVHDAIALIKSPLISYIQPQTCKAVGSLLLQYFTKKKIVTQEPPMTQDAFWNYQIDEIDSGYQHYVFPLYASRQLSEISDYCKKHSIELSFIILPTHVDLQERVDHAHLRQKEIAFKQFLISLAPTFDLDIVSEFTKNKHNFDDPKHVCAQANDYIINQVWGQR